MATNTAVHYDEWYSYRNFSSQKLSTIISFYPTSNNHVFYNVLSHFFVMLPGHLTLLMRITSVVASLIGTWYLFKLCKTYGSETAAWMVILIYSSAYNVLLYAAQARGYGLLNLFTILSIYHAAQFNYSGISGSKIFFVIVQALGLFTVPTFIYCLVPIYLYLIINLPRNNFGKAAIALGLEILAAIGLTLLLYLPILISENASVLLHTNTSEGKFSLSDSGAFDSILYFLRKMYYEVLGVSYPLLSLLLFVGMLLWLRKRNAAAYKLYWLCLIIVVCPILIVLAHNFFAYGRNWIFLCVPAALLCLLIAEPLAQLLRRILPGKMQRNVLKQSVFVLALLFYINASLQFLKKHKLEYAIDYKMAAIAKALPNLKSIAITEGGFEFYAADVVQGGLEGRMLEERIPITLLNTEPHQDLLIIAVDKVAQNKKYLSNYKMAYYANNMFFFIKRS